MPCEAIPVFLGFVVESAHAIASEARVQRHHAGHHRSLKLRQPAGSRRRVFLFEINALSLVLKGGGGPAVFGGQRSRLNYPRDAHVQGSPSQCSLGRYAGSSQQLGGPLSVPPGRSDRSPFRRDHSLRPRNLQPRGYADHGPLQLPGDHPFSIPVAPKAAHPPWRACWDAGPWARVRTLMIFRLRAAAALTTEAP